MNWAMRKRAAGPGACIMLQDLENLKAFGFHGEMRSIRDTAKASKLRVAATVAKDTDARCEDIARAQANHLHRPFGAWHSKSFFRILLDNKSDLEVEGITIDRIRSETSEQELFRNGTHGFQGTARSLIKTTLHPFNDENRIRQKVRRWNLEGPAAHVGQRISRNLIVVGQCCRPCVLGFMFRTLWNGWPTTARMRTMKGAPKTVRCLFGCECGDDRIEHYLVCRVVWKILPQISIRSGFLSIAYRSRQCMLLAERGLQEVECERIAIAVYAIARSVQNLRGQGPLENGVTLIRYYATSV
jgi:hypothetical protein